MKPPAFKLPVLLAQLPKSGLNALVRPVKWPANSFYKVSHTDLKFRETEGKINVGGKAWGQLFWRGKLMEPTSVPAPRIRGCLKNQFVTVNYSTLNAAEKAEVDGAAAVLEAQREAWAASAIERAQESALRRQAARTGAPVRATA
ncbi:uncharacterized protein EHS24_006975 [Apiotrichum porosum]|uniref:Uncharacterized protein n=1 Tax=Apiotrichum porosum TaxID=105984 RepID=A0A427XWT3_9TREE|nr:uncharacterized protein EHS24_006975 [Apiotrichum porosum]RSH83300.1 hypothetical protein EHS24_006975 [Apiotrichum porosum]